MRVGAHAGGERIDACLGEGPTAYRGTRLQEGLQSLQIAILRAGLRVHGQGSIGALVIAALNGWIE